MAAARAAQHLVQSAVARLRRSTRTSLRCRLGAEGCDCQCADIEVPKSRSRSGTGLMAWLGLDDGCSRDADRKEHPMRPCRCGDRDEIVLGVEPLGVVVLGVND